MWFHYSSRIEFLPDKNTSGSPVKIVDTGCDHNAITRQDQDEDMHSIPVTARTCRLIREHMTLHQKQTDRQMDEAVGLKSDPSLVFVALNLCLF